MNLASIGGRWHWHHLRCWSFSRIAQIPNRTQPAQEDKASDDEGDDSSILAVEVQPFRDASIAGVLWFA